MVGYVALLMGLLAPEPDPWWAHFLMTQAPLLLDWGQTLNIAQHPDHWHELNPLLGPHPSTGSVNMYFGLATLGNLGAGLLPSGPRKIVMRSGPAKVYADPRSVCGTP